MKRTETTVLLSTRVLPTVRAFSTVSVEMGFSMKSCERGEKVSFRFEDAIARQKSPASRPATHSRRIVRESLEDGHLNVLSRRRRPTESWRRANDEGMGPLFGVELLDILVKGGVDLGVLVGRDDEGGALASEHSFGRGAVGLDDADDLEAGAELVLETEGVVPGSCLSARKSQQKRKESAVR